MSCCLALGRLWILQRVICPHFVPGVGSFSETHPLKWDSVYLFENLSPAAITVLTLVSIRPELSDSQATQGAGRDRVEVEQVLRGQGFTRGRGSLQVLPVTGGASPVQQHSRACSHGVRGTLPGLWAGVQQIPGSQGGWAKGLL